MRLYRKERNSADDLSAVGIPADKAKFFAEEAIEVWPVNATCLVLFDALSTQWRIGVSGATGLDYSVIPAVMDVKGIAKEDRNAIFSDIRIMEKAALNEMKQA